MKQYQMSNLSPAKQFLGLDITRLPDGSIVLSQQTYIDSVVKRFGMEDANSALTPLYHKIRLDTDMSTDREVDSAVYHAIVGSLMYAATSTRPDIAYSVATLCRYNAKPYTTHMTAVKRVLRYLKGTSDVGLIFSQKIDIGSGNGCLAWLYRFGLRRQQSRQKVSRRIYLLRTRRTNRLAIEETASSCNIDHRSGIRCLFWSYTQGPMPYSAIQRRYR